MSPDQTQPSAADLEYTFRRERIFFRNGLWYGLEVCHAWNDATAIASVRLPLTDAQWVDLAKKDGRFLGVCCGNISDIRDHLLSALRESGWINTDNLRRVIVTAREHGDLLPSNDVTPQPDDPWPTIARVWAAVEPYAKPDASVLPPRARDPRDPKDALLIVSGLALKIAFDGLFTRDEVAARRCFRGVDRMRDLASIAPAITTLHARLADLWPGDFVGVALVRRNAPDEVIETYGGHAVYVREDDASETIAWWKRGDPEIEAQIRFRPVRVTLARGLEFTDESEGT